MRTNEIKARAYDAIVTAFYNGKLTQTYVEALINFVNQFDVGNVQEEVEEKTATLKVEPVEKPKKVPKAKAPKTIDDGKISACFKAGWSLTKIADEIGCSAPTVKAHLKEMGLVQ